MLGHQSVQSTEMVYSTISKTQATRAIQALDTLVKPKNDAETNNKLEKLRILLPEKSDEQLMALLEVL